MHITKSDLEHLTKKHLDCCDHANYLGAYSEKLQRAEYFQKEKSGLCIICGEPAKMLDKDKTCLSCSKDFPTKKQLGAK